MKPRIENKAIQGARQRMLSTDIGGGLVRVQRTQLISARVDEPRQFLVTLAQIATEQGSTPWEASFDGYLGTWVPPGLVFNAPAVPSVSVGGVFSTVLQCNLRWGAGGVSYTAAFDYPVAGGSFGITADTIDINVGFRGNASPGGIEPERVPVIGAFMVEGVAADPQPLRWAESTRAFAPGEFLWWSVKPYARKLRLMCPFAGTVGGMVWGQFYCLNGPFPAFAGLRQFMLTDTNGGSGPPGIDAVIDVPPGAEFFSLYNVPAAQGGAGVGTLVYPEWQIGYT